LAASSFVRAKNRRARLFVVDSDMVCDSADVGGVL